MNSHQHWLVNLGEAATYEAVDGLVPVHAYRPDKLQPEQVAIMLKAAGYGADAVFFEAGRNGRPPIPQAFVFASNGPADDPDFADIHRRLWSGVGYRSCTARRLALCSFFVAVTNRISFPPAAIPSANRSKNFGF